MARSSKGHMSTTERNTETRALSVVDHPPSDSNAIMIVTGLQTQASDCGGKGSWYANSRATEDMSDQRE